MPADCTVAAIGPRRDRAFNDQDVLTLVLLHGVMLGFFSLVTGRSHDHIRILDGEQVEDDFTGGRLVGAQESFRIAGAALVLNPDHRRTIILNGPGDLWQHRDRQRQGRGRGCAELDEIATIDAPCLHPLEDFFGDLRGDIQVGCHGTTSFRCLWLKCTNL